MVDAQTELRRFNKELETLNASLEIVKKFGLDGDILEAYLAHNLKISGKKAREIITCIDDFHRKTVNRLIVKDLSAE